MTLENTPGAPAEGKKSLPESIDMAALMEEVQNMPPEKIMQKIRELNRIIQFGGQTHEIQVVTDPRAQTWACSRIPKKQVLKDGKIVETGYYHYFIIVPFHHLAIDDDKFLLGELTHELGHALYTDWKRNKGLIDYAGEQGYPMEAMSMLLNVIEDPRMEHVSVYPLQREGHKRDWFWQKNKRFILGNIGEGIAKGDPVSQFDFLIKLYSLWALHEQNAEDENIEPWNDLQELNEDVQTAWEKVRETIHQLVGIGGYRFPEMRSSVVEQKVRDIIWPAKRELIDKYGMPKREENEENQGNEGSEGGQPGDPDSGAQPMDPDDIENLPPEIQQVIQQQIQNYKQQIEIESKKQIEIQQAIEAANKKIEEEKQARLAKADGMKNAEDRKKYNELLRNARVIQTGMRKLFEKYFPKISFPKDIYARRGKKYEHREHMKRFRTGLEKPMATPNIPEKAGFIMQLIIDKSGSMSGKRIEEVVKTVVGILEASKEYPIYIEILASDHENGGIRPEYIIKSFDDEFEGASAGQIKSRLVSLLEQCNGGNKDAESLRWAVPRIVAKKRMLSSEYEKISALVVFLSDAEVQGQQDPEAVNELRKKVTIIGGVVDPDPSIKQAVELAYGPTGEGSFCPASLAELPREFEKTLRKKIGMMFRR